MVVRIMLFVLISFVMVSCAPCPPKDISFYLNKDMILFDSTGWPIVRVPKGLLMSLLKNKLKIGKRRRNLKRSLGRRRDYERNTVQRDNE